MIHYLKYNFLESLNVPIAQITCKFVAQNKLEDVFKNALLIPVPITRRRVAQRGLNQAELIASEPGRLLNCSIQNNLIKRTKFNKPQADIVNWKERKINIKNSFEVKDKQTLKNLAQKYKFILIDDVSTSGATLEECARVLKSAGAKEIWALVIARG